MSEDAHLLWRANNEYRLRLTKALNSVELLTQLLRTRADAQLEPYMGLLGDAHITLAALANEHRDWRYRYFYDSGSDKRMVQDDRAVIRALSGFSRMHTQHQRVLNGIWEALDGLARPATYLTAVATGDLWDIMRRALADLASFDRYLQAEAQ